MASLLGDLRVLSLLPMIDVPLFRQILEIDERLEHAPPSRQSSAHNHAVTELAHRYGGRLCHLREAGILRIVLTRPKPATFGMPRAGKPDWPGGIVSAG